MKRSGFGNAKEEKAFVC